jgi:undecaprenyl-diphosphatase
VPFSQVNAFDFSILSFLNRFEGQHPSFDGAVVFLSNNGFLRGGILAALCWWAWFKNGEDTAKNKDAREVIISAMLACVVSIVIARLVVMAFPFRVRPISDPTNGLHFPASRMDWQNWSSFPSDHAMMFFTLTTCLFFVSRVMGWIALFDSVVLICLPRVYLGIHYPTDILAGAAIGIGIGLLANGRALRSFLAKGVLAWIQKYPGSFYAVFFLFMYQVTVIFFDLRYVATTSVKVLLKP